MSFVRRLGAQLSRIFRTRWIFANGSCCWRQLEEVSDRRVYRYHALQIFAYKPLVEVERHESR